MSITISNSTTFNDTTSYVSVCALSETKIVIAYRDISGSNYGTAIVGDIANNIITFGSEQVFSMDEVQHVNIVSISSTKFVIVYQNKASWDYKGTSISGTVSGTTITYGSETFFNNASTNAIDSIKLDTDKFVVSFKDQGSGSVGKCVIGTLSGTSISYGSEYTFSNSYIHYSSVCALDTTHFVVCAKDFDGSVYHGVSFVGTVSGTSISYGSEQEFYSSDDIEYIHTCALDSNHIAIIFRKGSQYGSCYIGTVSGNTISYGTRNDYKTTSINSQSLCMMDSETIIVAFNDVAGSGYVSVLKGTVSGNSVSFDDETVVDETSISSSGVIARNADSFIVGFSPQTTGKARVGTIVGVLPPTKYVFNADTTEYIQTTRQSDTKFIINYAHDGYGKCKVADISSGVITYADQYIFNLETTSEIKTDFLDTTSSVCVWLDDNTSYLSCNIQIRTDDDLICGMRQYISTVNTDNISVCSMGSAAFVSAYNIGAGKAIYCQRVEYTINKGVVAEFSSNDVSAVDVCMISETKFLVAYKDTTGKCKIGDISGTSITFGSEYIFNNASTDNIVCVSYDSTHVVIGFKDSDTYGKSIICSVSGTVVSFASKQAFTDVKIDNLSIDILDSTYFLFSYSRDTSNEGYNTLGTISSNVITYGDEKVFNEGTTGCTSTCVFDYNTFITAFKDCDVSDHGTCTQYDIDGLVKLCLIDETIDFDTSTGINNIFDMTDDLNLTDIVNMLCQVLLTDDLNLTDSMLKSFYISLTESFNFNEIIDTLQEINVSENINYTDLIENTNYINMFDGFELNESINFTISLIVSEVINAIDTIQTSNQVLLSELITFSAEVKQLRYILLNDSIELISNIGFDSIINILDTIGLLDNTTISNIFGILDVLGVSDTIERKIFITVIDNIGLLDTFVNNTILEIQDTINSNDHICNILTNSDLFDSLGVNDNIDLNMLLNIQDAMLLVDNLHLRPIIRVDEIIALSSVLSISKRFLKFINEIITFGCNIGVGQIINVLEVVDFQDVSNVLVKIVLDEQIVYSDLCNIINSLELVDGFNITEELRTSVLMSLSDGLGISEILNIFKSIIVSDNLNTNTNIEISNDFNILENILLNDNFNLQNIINIIDNIDTNDTTSFERLINITDGITSNENITLSNVFSMLEDIILNSDLDLTDETGKFIMLFEGKLKQLYFSAREDV